MSFADTVVARTFLEQAFIGALFKMSRINQVMGERGRKLLVLRNYKFYYERTMASGEEKWRCCTKRCPASLKVLGEEKQLISSNETHNHAPYLNRQLERKNFFALARQKALNRIEVLQARSMSEFMNILAMVKKKSDFDSLNIY